MFRPVESSVSFPKLEEEVLRFWKERQVYEKSLEARAGQPAFVFYEGPPTANGLPHPGHCLTRAIKDLFPRYRTMRGFRCERKAGWDTHGLPVEVEVSKELGIHAKDEIEAYGVEPFIHKCLESVFRYMKQWEQLTERLGFWIHLDEAYVTYHQSYVESVWWALRNLFDRGLLYQGHKIVWWWPQGGTALSSGEVGQGYRQVADPSVYVRFPIIVDDQAKRLGIDDKTDLLVWTTTPWTLPSNQFVAISPTSAYAIVEDQTAGRKIIMAAALVEAIMGKVGHDHRVVGNLEGKQLIGLHYQPPFDYYYRVNGTKKGRLRTDTAGVAVRRMYYQNDCRFDAEDAEKALEKTEDFVAWRVVPGSFVTLDSGTGLVHEAPAFGEVDYDVLIAQQSLFEEGQGPKLINAVAPDGRFTAEAPDYKGRNVKEADKDLIRELKTRGLLYHQEQYLHDYPFCWRAEEDPLIQYPRKSWFIRTTRFKEKMLANNARINWLPEHIREGRFGNFLETNVDWALSRERYWGTPLPIWVCEETGHMESVASYEELLAKPGVQGTEAWEVAKKANPNLSEHLKVHKPYIDEITYDSPKAPGKRMRRVADVIDCWFDSGAMPFAQWGYPSQPGSREKISDQFPADFISEALDQTRGWFYSLLAISTLLFSEEEGEPPAEEFGSFYKSDTPDIVYPHPYKTCVVLGLMLSETITCTKCGHRHLSEVSECEKCGGTVVRKIEKMSKSKRNYREPSEIFNRYGADALRWYFYANQPPWNSIIYSERAIKESIPEFLLRLWNVYSFFVIYANIDGFDPAASIEGSVGQLDSSVLAKGKDYRAPKERSELDRWILSELNRTAAAVIEAMDAYDNFGACARITEFVDALSNWYVRRSRDRFWAGGQSADKTDAYWTLYECLVTTAKLVAPFVPFLAETLWQNLAVGAFGEGRTAESVHLCDYPQGDAGLIDETLSRQMALAREIVSLGHSARMGARLKVRQPIARVEVVLADAAHKPWLEEHGELIRKELNVKQVELIQHAEQYITYSVLPDLKKLGPRLGKRLPALRKLLADADPAKLMATLEAEGQVTFVLADGPVVLTSEDLQVRLQAKEGWAAAQGRSSVVVISTELTPELIAEGHAREVVHVIQTSRKEMGLEYTDRIRIVAATPSKELCDAIVAFSSYIEQETLSVDLEAVLLAEDAAPSADLPAAHAHGMTGSQRFEAKVSGDPLTLYVKVVPSGNGDG